MHLCREMTGFIGKVAKWQNAYIKYLTTYNNILCSIKHTHTSLYCLSYDSPYGQTIMVTHILIFQVNYSYSGSYTHYHWQRAYVLAVLFFVQYRIHRFEFVDFGSIIMRNCTVVVVSRIILLMYPTMTTVNNNYIVSKAILVRRI